MKIEERLTRWESMLLPEFIQYISRIKSSIVTKLSRDYLQKEKSIGHAHPKLGKT